jgi:hypothetical protein
MFVFPRFFLVFFSRFFFSRFFSLVFFSFFFSFFFLSFFSLVFFSSTTVNLINYRPWVFHSTSLQQVIVVDPVTERLYILVAPNNRSEPISLGAFPRDGFPTAFGSTNITSVTYDHESHLLVIGTRSDGIFPGKIAVIDISKIDPTKPIGYLWMRPLNL